MYAIAQQRTNWVIRRAHWPSRTVTRNLSTGQPKWTKTDLMGRPAENALTLVLGADALVAVGI
jgi:hypothetical protein